MAEAQFGSRGIGTLLRELLGDHQTTTGPATAEPDGSAAAAAAQGVALPGGRPAPHKAQAYLAQSPDTVVATDTTRCPVSVVVAASTRLGDLPLRGIEIFADGARLGVTDENGSLRGIVSACEGRMRIKAVYANADRRVKHEEFTLEISGIDPAARQAKGGQARNFIAKVQDVFGSGAGGFPGDKDFTDSYAGAGLVTMAPTGPAELRVAVRMATLSLAVPYRNQNDSAEVIRDIRNSGAELCMPSSGEMQARYWGLEAVSTAPDGSQSRAAIDRRDIMTQAYSRAPTGYSLGQFPRHWQNWDNLRGAMRELAEASAPASYRIGTGPAGGAVETIPGPYADGLAGVLAKGLPVVVSTYATTAGHVMTAIGAVARHDGRVEWMIMNDPNGTLASADSLYGTLALRGAVGLNAANDPADLRAVQEALIRTGHYKGEAGAPVDSANPEDATIAAIRAFQGRNADGIVSPGGQTERTLNARLGQNTRPGYSAAENETNRAGDERGRHVYYSDETEGNHRGNFRLKGQAWSSVIEPVTALTTAQIAARLNPGVPEPQPAAGDGATGP